MAATDVLGEEVLRDWIAIVVTDLEMGFPLLLYNYVSNPSQTERKGERSSSGS